MPATPYNNNNISSPPRAYACEGGEEKRVGEKGESRESVMRWSAEAGKDGELRQLTEGILGGARVEWAELVRAFGLEQVEKQHVYPTYASYKGHLINWARKHYGTEGGANINKDTTSRQRSYDNETTQRTGAARGYGGRGPGAGGDSRRRAPGYHFDPEEARRSF